MQSSHESDEPVTPEGEERNVEEEDGHEEELEDVFVLGLDLWLHEEDSAEKGETLKYKRKNYSSVRGDQFHQVKAWF